MVQDHHDDGLVLLTQKRLGFKRYEYRATKRAIPRPVRYFRDTQNGLLKAAE